MLSTQGRDPNIRTLAPLYSLGHSDGSVTAIYNRYGYVREMRRALVAWANELTGSTDVRVFGDVASKAA